MQEVIKRLEKISENACECCDSKSYVDNEAKAIIGLLRAAPTYPYILKLVNHWASKSSILTTVAEEEDLATTIALAFGVDNGS